MKSEYKDYLKLLSYTYMQHAKYEKALVYLMVLKKLFPNDLQVVLSRAFSYLGLKSYEAALNEAEEGLKMAESEDDKEMANRLKMKAMWGMKDEEAKEVKEEELTTT